MDKVTRLSTMDKVTRHSSTFMITDILRSEPSESESSEMNSTSDELRENGDMDSSGDDTVHPTVRDTQTNVTAVYSE